MPRYICDLHVHSRYSQACSRDISVKMLEKWARVKGVDLLGTGDFTHPLWYTELKEELTEERQGIHYTATGQPFLLQTEISLIYTQGRGRRIHLIVLAPSFDVVDRITAYLLRHGRVDYDGRPIFKIPAWEFVKELKAISDEIEIIPAHAWTPWFSLFGSDSGFDSLQECFQEQAGHIHAIETGLSSDVEMNDRLDQLKGVRYVSFSDSHSHWPWRLGREATIFELPELSYQGIIQAIRTGKGFWGTVEVEPSYGKYHYDGHRACSVVLSPEETKRLNGICPVCKQPLTIGVLNRVELLADHPLKEGREGHSQRFYKLLPLHEILSLVIGQAMTTKRVWDEYWKVLKAGKNEYDVLINATEERLREVTTPEIAKAIIAVREGNIRIRPGYDGVYGVLEIPGLELLHKEEERPARQGRPSKRVGEAAPQRGLSDFF
jgi:uncharacterized protein (TIGR00375 family)